jgi:hypothetical protein
MLCKSLLTANIAHLVTLHDSEDSAQNGDVGDCAPPNPVTDSLLSMGFLVAAATAVAASFAIFYSMEM